MIHTRMTCRWCAAVTGAAATLLVLAGAAGPAQAALHQTGAARPRPVTAYVVSSGSDTVTPVNTVTSTPGRPIRAGDEPLSIAITPNGRTVYAANLTSNTVTPIRTANDTPGRPIQVGNFPFAIAITPAGKKGSSRRSRSSSKKTA